MCVLGQVISYKNYGADLKYYGQILIEILWNAPYMWGCEITTSRSC